MTKENDKFPGIIVEEISPRDKEVILLTAVFFWGKYMRREINSKDFKPVLPEVDFSDPASILGTGFELHRQENNDIDGDAVKAISALLLNHPRRGELFPRLNDQEIRQICGEIDDMFENQEMCAFCEAWSYYELGPEDFAIESASLTLWLTGGDLGINWFSKIYGRKIRDEIVKVILREKLSLGTGRFLSANGNK